MRKLQPWELVVCFLLILGPTPATVQAQPSQPSLAGTQGPAPSTTSQTQAQLANDDKDISRDKCLMARPLFGDLEYLPGGDNWSAGVAVSTQAIKYTFGTKKAPLIPALVSEFHSDITGIQ